METTYSSGSLGFSMELPGPSFVASDIGGRIMRIGFRIKDLSGIQIYVGIIDNET